MGSAGKKEVEARNSRRCCLFNCQPVWKTIATPKCYCVVTTFKEYFILLFTSHDVQELEELPLLSRSSDCIHTSSSAQLLILVSQLRYLEKRIDSITL